MIEVYHMRSILSIGIIIVLKIISSAFLTGIYLSEFLLSLRHNTRLGAAYTRPAYS